MNPEIDLPPVIQVEDAPTYSAPVGRGLFAGAWRLIVFLWKYIVGVLFCQSIAGGIMIVGWSYRLAQRSALRYWWSRSEHKQKGGRLADHLDRYDSMHDHLHWPNWFAYQNFRQTLRRKEGASAPAYAWQLLKTPFHSLGLNLKVGLQGIFNTWILTMPACILWLFAWYDGWNNSFNKGYEQAPVGPLTGILGIVLFITAMLYVPLGQARQAVTGDWRSFYHFSFIWGLVRRHWLACLILAGLTSAFFLPLTIMKTAPMFFGMKDPAFAAMTNPQALKFLNSYFFWCAFLVFPLFVLLRVLAARIYARGVLHGIQTGEISLSDLASSERAELQRLNLIQVNPPRSRHVLLRVAGSTTSLAFFSAGIFAMALIWFTFVAQIFVSAFFKYDQAVEWLNQPLVQLPWFRYIPPHIQNPAVEFFATAFVLALIFGGLALARRVRAAFRKM
jgi:hypothetical protein